MAIARAIATRPAIVLADEPTANIDSANADALLEMMETLNREQQVTFLFSTHDPRVMARARRLIRLGRRPHRERRRPRVRQMRCRRETSPGRRRSSPRPRVRPRRSQSLRSSLPTGRSARAAVRHGGPSPFDGWRPTRGYDGPRTCESDMQEHPTGSRECRTGRTDEFGRAFAGSQLQIQIAVSRRQAELSEATAQAIGLPVTSSLVWTSPLEEDCFAEYRDRFFLRAVGLQHLAPSLGAFWPRRGPCWDGLARIETAAALSGVVLVEAKSYPEEMEGSGCKAEGASLQKIQIQRALEEAKTWWFAVPESADWLGPLYQFANRLAHVYLLRWNDMESRRG